MASEDSLNFVPSLSPELKEKASQLIKNIGKPSISQESQLADERLAALQESKQIAMQFRDDSLAWQEAYLAERKRADLLQAKLFEVLNLSAATVAPTEIKHVVQSQIGKRSLSFRERRAAVESLFSAHDAGIYQEKGNQEKENQNAS